MRNYQSRATSTTRTVFRLNTNQSHAYGEFHYKGLNTNNYRLIIKEQTYCDETPFSMWRVVSTNPRFYSPWHGDSRLLVITYSYSRISGYNPCSFFILFCEISSNSRFCISLSRNMWHVDSPQYKGHDDLSLSLLSFPI